ncbi:MAG TPA: S8 family serine peptidase [Thermoanaerobaculia bacterium]
MRRLALLLLSVVVLVQPAVAATRNRDTDPVARDRAEGREVIVEARHVLVTSEMAELEAKGAKVLSPLPNGRYLVRLAPGASLEADLRIASVEAVRPEQKVDRRVAQALRNRAFGKLNVFFHDDVEVGEARRVIEDAGGSLANPLAIDFVPPRYLVANVPAAAVAKLAQDGRVRMVRAPLRLKLETNNQTSARLSRVTDVQAAPYSLTGTGSVLSMHELGVPAANPDWADRFTAHFTGGGDTQHAAHVIGTIIGSGAGNERAKGMAPAATLHLFEAGDIDDYLEQKEVELKTLGAIADNNSWGYTIGWEFSGGNWVWWDDADLHGAYLPEYTSGIDLVARRNPMLFVHSAGNDGDDTGPLLAPNPHKHVNPETLDVLPETYCYSQDGTGNDCTAPCNPGRSFCETARHLTSAPFQVIGVTAGAKNVVAIGSVDAFPNIANYSARGPARDGRVKPDLVARGGVGSIGEQVISTQPGSGYFGLQGTSMAAPVVTGIAGILAEQYRKSFGGVNPDGPTLKALLIAGADDLYTPGPDYTSGHGLVNAKASADLIIADANSGSRIRRGALTQGEQVEIPVRLDASGKLRVVLTWFDPDIVFFSEEELDQPALVNNLDLKLLDLNGADVLPYVLNKQAPTAGATRGVNNLDNTEVVEILNATPGVYRVVFRATAIRDTRVASQPYVLVTNGILGASALPCTDVQEQNDTPDRAYGLLASAQLVNGALCTAGDVDYFRFRAERAGPVNVRLTAGATRIRATLLNGATQLATIEVPAGESATLSSTITGATDLLVRIEAVGTVVSPSNYTVTPEFGVNVPRRRRTVPR